MLPPLCNYRAEIVNIFQNMKPILRGLKILGAGAGCLLTGSYVNYSIQDNRKRRLSVANLSLPEVLVGGVNIIPIVKTCFGLLPAPLREHALMSAAAPKEADIPRDKWDLRQQSPYVLEQVNPNVWRVEYIRENHLLTKPVYREAMKVTGLNFNEETTCAKVMAGAEQWGREVSAMAHNDIKDVKEYLQNEKTFQEMVLSPAFVRENMMVVRLNNGELVLYAPVKIHDETEFGQFLEQHLGGTVSWIVIPSSEHNLQLPGIIRKYPEAKIIGSKTSEKKLNFVSALPRGKLDYDYTDVEDLAELNSKLSPEGLSLHYISGDCATNSLFCVAHRVALECDILYTHADGEGFLMMDKQQFRELRPNDFFMRLFKLRLLSKPNSPNGFLPSYRFWAMDPQLMWTFQVTPPKDDGSSSKDMASSLRTALALDFDQAVGVHFRTMKADEFRRAVDLNWNWLDGESLLPPKNE